MRKHLFIAANGDRKGADNGAAAPVGIGPSTGTRGGARAASRIGALAAVATIAVLAIATGAHADASAPAPSASSTASAEPSQPSSTPAPTVAPPPIPTVSDAPQKMPTFNGGVYAMAYDGNTLYVGGSFTSVNWGGKKSARSDLAAINASTGALLPWAPAANGKVEAIAVDLSTHGIYVAGAFGTINASTRDGLAEIDGASGALESFKHSVSGTPQALAVGHGRLYVGGKFTSIDGKSRTDLAAFALSTGALYAGWAPTATDTVYTIVSDTNRVYLGGKFQTINGVKGTAKLAAVNPDTGVRDIGFKPSVAIIVYAIAIGPKGIFAAEGGQGGRAIAYAPDGTAQWALTTDGDIAALTYLNNVLYVGGHFDNACKSPANGVKGVCLDGSDSRVKLAAANGANGALLPWNPQGNGVHGVFAMASNPTLSTVAAGGEFTTIKAAAHGRFAQFR